MERGELHETLRLGKTNDVHRAVAQSEELDHMEEMIVLFQAVINIRVARRKRRATGDRHQCREKRDPPDLAVPPVGPRVDVSYVADELLGRQASIDNNQCPSEGGMLGEPFRPSE